MLPGELSLLWRAIRRPMFVWWARVGVWWLAGLAVFITLDLVNRFRQDYWDLTGVLTFTPTVAVMIVWAVAGLHCARLCRKVYEDHASPAPDTLLGDSFVLAYLQGTLPVSILLLLGAVHVSSYSFSFGPVGGYGLDYVPFLMPHAMFLMVWLTALMVNNPGCPQLLFVFPLALFAGTAVLTAGLEAQSIVHFLRESASEPGIVQHLAYVLSFSLLMILVVLQVRDRKQWFAMLFLLIFGATAFGTYGILFSRALFAPPAVQMFSDYWFDRTVGGNDPWSMLLSYILIMAVPLLLMAVVLVIISKVLNWSSKLNSTSMYPDKQ